MTENSIIEWTTAIWNWATGCTKTSEGCRNCYKITIRRMIFLSNLTSVIKYMEYFIEEGMLLEDYYENNEFPWSFNIVTTSLTIRRAMLEVL